MSNSFISKIYGKILKFTKPSYMDLQDDVNDFLAKKDSFDEPVRSIFKSIDFDDLQVFTFGSENAKNTIIFMHGGAYVNQINYQHYLYCLKMARKLDAYVLAPVYPLAPHHKANESFNLITKLYENIIHKRENVILMGDSAGGGFVLSFCQYLKTINLPQPNQIVAFSPWVDIAMTNPPYDSENDPILGEVGLKEIGRSWAGELSVDDYKVSPIFGDNSNLAKTLIFAGTDEIFYKDIKKYVENLKENNVDVKFITGEGLFHIYPLFPMPEAKEAFKELKKEIIG